MPAKSDVMQLLSV